MVSFIVLAHSNPKHLHNLVLTLSTDFPVHVHIDHKVPISKFSRLCQSKQIPARYVVEWGTFDVVKATLELMKYVVRDGTERIVLLSGTDFPACSNNTIRTYFKRNKDSECINCVPLPSSSCGKSEAWIPKEFREFFPEMVPYGGSQWWAITKDAAKYILSKYELKHEFMHCEIPDEFYFHTLLGNSKFATNIIGNVTYRAKEIKRKPKVLTIKEYKRLKERRIIQDRYGIREVLFARKFDDLITDEAYDCLHNFSS